MTQTNKKKILFLTEGDSDKPLFQMLLVDYPSKDFLHTAGIDRLPFHTEVQKRITEDKPDLIIYLVDADYKFINNGGYQARLRLLSDLQIKYPVLRGVIISPKQNSDGVLEDILLETVCNNPNHFTITCFDQMQYLRECQQLNQVSSHYRKLLLYYFTGCFNKDSQKTVWGNSKELLTAFITHSPRLQEIKTEIENIIQSL